LTVKGGFLEHSLELFSEVVHVIAELHDRYNPFDLIMDLLTIEFFQPLVMVLPKVRTPWVS
jgi:hypothetical protein